MNSEGRFSRHEVYAEKKALLKESWINREEKLISCRRLWRKGFSFNFFGKRKISYEDFLVFNQQLATLLRSGIPFIRSIEILKDNISNLHFQEIIKKISVKIQTGIQISEAFAISNFPFSRIYKSSLLAGEKSGQLEKILDQFNVFLEKMTRLRKKTISSLTYPVILVLFMFTMVIVISVFVIPKFTELYQNFEAKLPPITIFFLEITEFFKKNILFFFLILFFIYFTIRFIERLNPKIIIIDQYKTRLPFIGKVIIENNITIFTRTLSILIFGGIPIPEATSVAIESISNRFIFNQFKDAPDIIRQGNSLSDVIKNVSICPPIYKEMLKVGDQSGNLNRVMDEIADYFEYSIGNRLNTLISLIEPVIIITLGIVASIMLLSVYVPIFSAIQAVQ